VPDIVARQILRLACPPTEDLGQAAEEFALPNALLFKDLGDGSGNFKQLRGNIVERQKVEAFEFRRFRPVNLRSNRGSE
jgi:hypothetical protein